MKKIVRAGFVMLALLTAAGALPAQETTLRVAQVADISNPDPHKANDIYTANVINQIFNNLVKMNKKMEVQKDLAESWENPDGKTWIFRLKKGVKFHNGEEFAADDVKFTLERILDPKTSSPGKRLVSELDKVEVMDRHTVRLTTKQPFAPLLTNLTRYEMAMLNKKAVTDAGENFGKHPVGTGPFMFSERHHGDRVVLTRFDAYFEGPAKIKTIVYRAIPEDATRVVEMESGGIDIMYNLPPQDFDRIGKNPNVTTIEELFQSTTYLGFNAKVKPFENKLVRQALNYAVDKKAIIEAVWFNRGTPSYGPLSPTIWGFDPTLPFAYPYDPEKAKALLKQAGFAGGFDCVIWTDPRTERKSICEMVQAYLAQVGVTATIEAIEWGKFLVETRTGNGAKGLYIMGWTGTGDADGAVFSTFHSSGIGSNNRNFWSTPELDKLMEEGRTTLDQAKRKEIYAKVQRMIVEEAPNLFIGISKNLAAVRKGVKGFELFANNINPLYKVSIEK